MSDRPLREAARTQVPGDEMPNGSSFGSQGAPEHIRQKVT